MKIIGAAIALANTTASPDMGNVDFDSFFFVDSSWELREAKLQVAGGVSQVVGYRNWHQNNNNNNGCGVQNADTKLDFTTASLAATWSLQNGTPHATAYPARALEYDCVDYAVTSYASASVAWSGYFSGGQIDADDRFHGLQSVVRIAGTTDDELYGMCNDGLAQGVCRWAPASQPIWALYE